MDCEFENTENTDKTKPKQNKTKPTTIYEKEAWTALAIPAPAVTHGDMTCSHVGTTIFLQGTSTAGRFTVHQKLVILCQNR